MLMEICMKVNGLRTRRMATASIVI
jgi:hypothetical protein